MIIGLTPDSIAGFLTVLSKKRYDEPLPLYQELDLKKLVSALKTPFLRPNIKSRDTDAILKIIAHLFCLMIESHYAPNGNKRLAVVSLIATLNLNGYDLKTSEIRLYAMAMAVTWLSKYHLFDEAIEEIFEFLKTESVVQNSSKVKTSEKTRLRKEFVNFMENRS